MSESPKWTEEQREAIDAKGNIIVSAAAGSGKTAVLSERVIKLICDQEHPVSADRLLIVTFTNAAAAEMRARIEKRLDEECRSAPDNVYLLKQKHLISAAKICTIDSFCIDLVRENFELANVSPSFKIVTDAELLSIYASVFDSILERKLDENHPDFRNLLDIVDSEYGFDNLKNTVLDLFKHSKQMPFPTQFLERLRADYKLPFDQNHPWCQSILKSIEQRLIDLQNMVIRSLDRIETVENGERYNKVLQSIASAIFTLLEVVKEKDWDAVRDAISLMPSFRLPGFTGSTEECYSVFKAPSNALKAEKEKLLELFELSAEEIAEQISFLSGPVDQLLDFVLEFSATALNIQREENIFTFYDTEQMAFAMLCEPTDDSYRLTEAASSFFDRYDEVLVDEYQDVNNLQDMLFKILSNEEKHLFVVGDIKQSIYAFRGSNPENFLRQKDRALSEDSGDNKPQSIMLAKNFRSRKGVCDFVNFFFKQTMTAETGKLVYDSTEELVAGAQYQPNSAPSAELLVIDKMKEVDAEKMEVEGRCIADYIKRVMAEEPFLRDQDGLRKAEYSDFVIMMRSLGEKGAMLAGELRKNGIPVTYGKSLFLETVEISTFLSLLHVINNPDNDIALLSVMLSPIFGFTSDELARYRIDCRKSSLITAVHSAAAAGDRHAISFLSRLDDFRREAAMLSLPKLMTKLLLMTDYLNIVAAMPEGKTRRANLQLLVQYAAAYHENSAGGIGGFLNYIASQPSETFASAKISGGENVVRIMTMHKSKGLQFPICILTHLGDSIHQKDTHDSVLYDENVGLGFRYFDENTTKKIKSIGFRTIGESRRCERTEEELRVLYVAMTRAEERLAMFLPCNDLVEKIPAIATDLALNDGAISHRMLHGASSMGDWILTAAMRHPSATALREQTSLYIPELPTESKLDITIIDASKLDLSVTTTVVADEPKPIDPSLVAALKRNLAYSYPYDALRSIEAKSTVTVLANYAERDRFEFTAQPAFMLENGISAAKRGTATHHVMQFINFTDQPDVDAELERLVEWGFISEAEAAAIDREALHKFFADPLYRRILNADEIHREMRFLTELPAGLVDGDLVSELQDEKIVVQGAVDLCIIENGEPTVIDFKTDRVTNPSELIDAYAEQLNIYSTACQKIFDRPVRERIIYSFELHKTIPLP